MKCFVPLTTTFAIVAACAVESVFAQGAAIGEPAPPLSISEYLQAPDGANASWEQLRGKVVIVEFWTTWCGPCIAAIPHLNELAEEFADRPVQFIAISNESAEPVQRFLERREMKAWVVLDDNDATWRDYGIRGIPHTVIVDAEGNIAATTYPAELQSEHIEQVLAGEKPDLPDYSAAFATITAGFDPEGGTETPPLFQVMIREAAQMSGSSAMSGNAVTMYGATAAALVRYAYNALETRMEIVADLSDGAYTLVANVPREKSGDLRSLVQSAVESTFNITSEREIRRVPTLVLTLPDDGGHRLETAVEGAGMSMGSSAGRISITGLQISSFAYALESIISMPVIDETGLDDRFDIDFRFDIEVRDWTKEQRISHLQQVIHEQLGIELREAEREIEIVVIRNPDA